MVVQGCKQARSKPNDVSSWVPWPAVIVLLTSIAGCTGVGPDRGRAIQHVSAEQKSIELAAYMPDSSKWDRMYLRTCTDRRHSRPRTHRQLLLSDGRMEGAMIGLAFASETLASEPQSHSKQERSHVENSKAALLVSGMTGAHVAFDPPLVDWPATVNPEKPARFKAAASLLDGEERITSTGSAVRTVTVEGMESITAGGTHYAECLVLLAQTDLQFGLMTSITMTERLWLAPGSGIVRRTELIDGRYLIIIPFGASYEYELIRAREIGTPAEEKTVNLPTASVRTMLLFDALLPHPSVAGGFMEWAKAASLARH